MDHKQRRDICERFLLAYMMGEGSTAQLQEELCAFYEKTNRAYARVMRGATREQIANHCRGLVAAYEEAGW